MEYIRRINLKTDCSDRQGLINYCLHNGEQYVAIGWSCVFSKENRDFQNYDEFYQAVKKYVHEKSRRLNHALKSFAYVKEGDLFWTRDLEGFYWICRAKGPANPCYIEELDIGAVVPVVAYKFGMEVPGRIKASFNRANGGIIEDIKDDKSRVLMMNYSKYIFNYLSTEEVYHDIDTFEGNIIDNLPDFELEELVISYLQIMKNYYVLSNSIAKNSTTVKIECELMSKDKNNPGKAVVQVKAREGRINPEEYETYVNNGYEVYFYDGGESSGSNDGRYHIITKGMIEEFYHEYKIILPESITKWEVLFK